MAADTVDLDGTRIAWHAERLEAWRRGEHIAPVTVDMALTRACNYRCIYCYSQFQKNEGHKITLDSVKRLYDDFAEIGVKGVSLVSDGESTCNPIYPDVIEYGASVGLKMALGTNGSLLTGESIERIVPHLTYLRFNISACNERYAEVMGTGNGVFEQVVERIRHAVRIAEFNGGMCNVGLQMVLMPRLIDQAEPLVKLAKEVCAGFIVIKHCSDDERGALGIDYGKYAEFHDTLRGLELQGDSRTRVVVKWNKIRAGNHRSYSRCYGPPFLMQLSGSGLVAPCGMLFSDKFQRYHIGNFVETRFKHMWEDEKYWRVMDELASDRFNAQTMCGCLCLQDRVNVYLDDRIKAGIEFVKPEVEPAASAFV